MGKRRRRRKRRHGVKKKRLQKGRGMSWDLIKAMKLFGELAGKGIKHTYLTK